MTDDGGKVPKKVTGKIMLQAMLTHIWPKDKPGLRARVVIAVGLLIGAKVFFNSELILFQSFN